MPEDATYLKLIPSLIGRDSYSAVEQELLSFPCCLGVADPTIADFQ